MNRQGEEYEALKPKLLTVKTHDSMHHLYLPNGDKLYDVAETTTWDSCSEVPTVRFVAHQSAEKGFDYVDGKLYAAGNEVSGVLSVTVDDTEPQLIIIGAEVYCNIG